MPAEPAAPWPALPVPADPPIVSRGATVAPPAEAVPDVRPVLRLPDPAPDRPAAAPRIPLPEPDPWPALPDDSPLWTVLALPDATGRTRRLAEEQAGH
jgi:hypothetical protein